MGVRCTPLLEVLLRSIRLLVEGTREITLSADPWEVRVPLRRMLRVRGAGWEGVQRQSQGGSTGLKSTALGT